MRPRQDLGLEVIAYQPSKVFFQEMIVVVQQRIDKETDNSQFAKNIEACIKHHTNIQADVMVKTGVYDSILATDAPNIRNNHPLIHAPHRELIDASDIKANFKKAKSVSLSGTVDRARHTVHGVFTEITQTIYIGTSWLSGDFITADELAAGILHEVGHWFSYFVTLADSLLVNYVLSEISRDVVKESEATVKMELYLEAADVLGADEGKVRKAVSEKPDSDTLPVVLLEDVIRTSQDSNNGVRIYNIVACEQLADQFVSRIGAGAALARFMARAASRHDYKYSLSRPMKIVVDIFKTLGQLYWSPLIVPIMLLLGASPLHELYDPLPERLRRIRLDLVGHLRNGKHPKEIKQQLLDEIAEIEKLEKQFSRAGFDLYGAIWKYLIPSGRKDRKDKALFKDIEGLANNNLFVRAAQLDNR